MNIHLIEDDLRKRGLDIKYLDHDIMLRNVLDKELYSSYQNTTKFIIIAENPSFSETTQLVKIDCPYKNYEMFQVDLNHK